MLVSVSADLVVVVVICFVVCVLLMQILTMMSLLVVLLFWESETGQPDLHPKLHGVVSFL